MRYVILGRKLGRATRQVATRLGGQVQSTAQQKAPVYLQQGRVVAQQGRIVAAEGKRAGQSFWKRLAHAGRMLWHEVTGVFFAFFALFFIQGLWRTRAAYRQGAEHQHFMLYLAMTFLFLYFTISSFVRSRHKPQNH